MVVQSLRQFLDARFVGQEESATTYHRNKRRRHTPDQIIRKLAEGNKLLASGQELDEVCRHLEIAESTWHRWLAQYGGMKASDAAPPQGTRGRECPTEAPAGGRRVGQDTLREIASPWLNAWIRVVQRPTP